MKRSGGKVSGAAAKSVSRANKSSMLRAREGHSGRKREGESGESEEEEARLILIVDLDHPELGERGGGG